MTRATIFTRTDKGARMADSGSRELANDLRKVLEAIDGTSSVDALQSRLGFRDAAWLDRALAALVAKDLIREAEHSEGALDFTSPLPTDDSQRKAEERARREAEAKARHEAEAKARHEAEEKVRREAEAKARHEAEEKARREAEAKARHEAEAKARHEAEEKAQREAEAKARHEAEVKARHEAEAKARHEAEAKARHEAEEKARREAEAKAKARHEADGKARREAEEKLRREAEEKARREAEAKARQEAEDKVRRDAEEQKQKLAEEQELKLAAERVRSRAAEAARQEAEKQAKLAEEQELKRAAERVRSRAVEHARKEAEEQARKSAEEQELKAAEEQERHKAAELARQEAEEQARKLAEEKERRKAAERAREEAEAQARKLAEDLARRDTEDKVRRDTEDKVRRETEDKVRRETEDKVRREAEDKVRRDAEEKVRREAEEKVRREAEDKVRRDAEEAARREDEAQARRETEEKVPREAEEAARRDAERAGLEAETKARVTAEEKARREAEEKLRREQEAAANKPANVKAAAKEGQTGLTRSRKWGKPLALGIAALIVAGLVTIHLISFDGQIPQFEKLLAGQFQQPVKIQALRLSLVPQPHLRLEGISIGNEGQIRVPELKATGAIGNLSSDKKVFKSVELDSPVVTEAGLGWILFGKPLARDVLFGEVRALNVRLESKNLSLPAFDAKLQSDGDGILKTIVIESVDKNLNLELTSKGESVQIEFKARSFRIPFGSDLTLDDLVASGTANRNELAVTEFKGFAYGGILSGKAKLKWGTNWSLAGELNAKQIDTSRLLPSLMGDGRLVATAGYAMQAPDAARLFAANRLEGDFTVSRGLLLGVDLGRMLQGGAIRGETRFAELTGSLVRDRGATQLRQVRLTEGAMTANGTAEVDANDNVQGRFAVELKRANERQRANLALSGTLKKVEWHRP